jgi:two-component system, OmpR family, alkaline phosphatase synthesis response regulator PhoP
LTWKEAVSAMAIKRVLIVHDDPDMVMALRLPLESAGYEIVGAGTSEEGLHKVKETAPDLVIVDADLEADADLQVSLMLRNPASHSPYAAHRHIPILMLTAPHTVASLRSGPDEAYLPVDDFVDKPIDPHVLLEKVRALMP